MKKWINLFNYSVICALTLLTTPCKGETLKVPEKNEGTLILAPTNATVDVTAPFSWIQDYEASSFLEASVFVKKGRTAETSPAVMYAMLRPSQLIGIPARNAFRDEDLMKMKNDLDDVVIEFGDSRPYKNIKDPDVYNAKRKNHSQFETIVYATHEKGVMLFVLCTNSQKEHDKRLPDFIQFVNSYRATSLR